MQIDSAATVSIINRQTYDRLNSTLNLRLEPAKDIRTYTREQIPILGKCRIPVRHKLFKGTKRFTVYVFDGDSPNLLGTSWSEEFADLFPDVQDDANSINAEPENLIFAKYPELFQSTPGKYSKLNVHIEIDPNATPKYFKARQVPLAMKDRVQKAIDELIATNRIRRVDTSRWGTPIVPVIKPDGSIRITADYRITLNPVISEVKHPLPLVTELFAKLSGGTVFTKLDLTNAYLQFQLDPGSRNLTTITTECGLFEFMSMPFGISTASSIFQREMDKLLSGLSHVAVFQDDIVVTGRDRQHHDEKLDAVLLRLREAGLTLKREKCVIASDSVQYLGHMIDREGLRPIPERIIAINEMPAPQNVTQLKSFLGMINYYGHFLPNLATILAPLYKLLRKNEEWSWTKECQQTFNKAKELLKSSKVLTHYSTEHPIRVSADASGTGLGAVLSHVIDGQERPVYYASRSLAPAETKYSQLDKEGLAIIFAIKKFQQYLFARHFEIVTDHKPLLTVFAPDKPLSMFVPARMLRWKLLLSSHSYTITYKKGSSNSNADGLSRLPLTTSQASHAEQPDIPDLCMMYHLPESPAGEGQAATPLTSKLVSAKSRTDPVIAKVVKALRTGNWPEMVEDIKTFYSRRLEMTVEGDCLIWGNRLVVPEVLRDPILQHLHDAHPGVVRMKAMARLYIWWPSMDADITEICKSCVNCNTPITSPPASPVSPLLWPETPFYRIHMDLAGPFKGKMFLIIIDAYSKWLDVIPVKKTTSTVMIKHLRRTIAQHGLPTYLVTDNGPQFTSEEFENFCKMNYISHRLVSVFHPRSNGQAEAAVKHFKYNMKKIASDVTDTTLQRFIFAYRTTPHTTTGKTPASLLYGRELRTHLAAIIPSTRSKVSRNQERQTIPTLNRRRRPQFQSGDTIHSRLGNTWEPGIIVSPMPNAPMTFKIELESGRRIKCHVDNLKMRVRPSDSIPVEKSQSHTQNEEPTPLKSILRRSARISAQTKKVSYAL